MWNSYPNHLSPRSALGPSFLTGNTISGLHEPRRMTTALDHKPLHCARSSSLPSLDRRCRVCPLLTGYALLDSSTWLRRVAMESLVFLLPQVWCGGQQEIASHSGSKRQKREEVSWSQGKQRLLSGALWGQRYRWDYTCLQKLYYKDTTEIRFFSRDVTSSSSHDHAPRGIMGSWRFVRAKYPGRTLFRKLGRAILRTPK